MGGPDSYPGRCRTTIHSNKNSDGFKPIAIFCGETIPVLIVYKAAITPALHIPAVTLWRAAEFLKV
jgi:hypothetical protein